MTLTNPKADVGPVVNRFVWLDANHELVLRLVLGQRSRGLGAPALGVYRNLGVWASKRI